MNGEELNNKLERGIFGASIKQLAGAWGALETPTDMTFANGVNDSVTQQDRRVEATWDSTHNRLTIQAAAAGDGLWIPYLGNGMRNAVGVAQTPDHGLGTYTRAIGAGGVSWVATGPFSGCYAVTFTAGGGKVFAHIITPAHNHTAADPVTQAVDIATEIGAIPPAPGELAAHQISGVGIGFIFWTRIKGVWWRRVINTGAGSPATVITVEKKKLC